MWGEWNFTRQRIRRFSRKTRLVLVRIDNCCTLGCHSNLSCGEDLRHVNLRFLVLGWSVGPGPGGSAVDVATRERTAVSVSANERPGYELMTNQRAGHC